MSCDDLEDLILFFAGGVAEEGETRQVLQHLGTGCAGCAGRLAEAQAILAPLSLVVGSTQPPPEVRERLMARVAASGTMEGGRSKAHLPGMGAGASETADTASSSTGSSGRARAAAGAADTPARIGPAPEPPIPIRHPRSPVAGAPVPDFQLDAGSRFVRTWVVPTLAAALAAAFAGLAVYTPMHRERQAMEARMAQQDARLRILQADVEKAKRTLNLLRSPAVQVVSLAGAEAPRAAGRILWDRSGRMWHVFVADLAPLGPDRTYQLWFITTDHRMVSAGTFNVDASGQGELNAPVPEGLSPIALAAVTDEPAGGMPQPTGKIQIKGEVPTT